ncbi:MAG: hypothetical protein ACREC9_03215 [Methylocella sp.]
MKIAGSISLLMLVGGCSYYNENLLNTPTPTQVSNYATETGAVTVNAFDRSGTYGNRVMYSAEYLLSSITYTNQKCDEFFEVLAHSQQDSSFIDKVLTTSIAAATPLMAAYGVGATAISTTAAGVAFAGDINKFTSEIYLFAPFAGQLQRHVKEQMQAKSNNLSSLWKGGRLNPDACPGGGCYNELERMIAVRGQAQDYANICSISNFRTIIASSLEHTRTTCPPKTTGQTVASAVAPPPCISEALK